MFFFFLMISIWSYWEVEDERFKYMLFKSGDDCPSVTEGEKQRSVKVYYFSTI